MVIDLNILQELKGFECFADAGCTACYVVAALVSLKGERAKEKMTLEITVPRYSLQDFFDYLNYLEASLSSIIAY